MKRIKRMWTKASKRRRNRKSRKCSGREEAEEE